MPQLNFHHELVQYYTVSVSYSPDIETLTLMVFFDASNYTVASTDILKALNEALFE